MKKELIDTLYKEFEKDKELIKKNLMQYMDSVYLETSDEYGKVTLLIKYERKYANGQRRGNKQTKDN